MAQTNDGIPRTLLNQWFYPNQNDGDWGKADYLTFIAYLNYRLLNIRSNLTMNERFLANRIHELCTDSLTVEELGKFLNTSLAFNTTFSMSDLKHDCVILEHLTIYLVGLLDSRGIKLINLAEEEEDEEEDEDEEDDDDKKPNPSSSNPVVISNPKPTHKAPGVIFFGMDYFEETGILPTNGYPADFEEVLQTKYDRERKEREKKS